MTVPHPVKSDRKGKSLAFVLAALLALSVLPSFGMAKPASDTAHADSQENSNTTAKDTSKANEQEVINAYGKLPIYFAPNNGQLDSRVKYYATGAGYNFYLTNDGVTYSFIKNETKETDNKISIENDKDSTKPEASEGYCLRVGFEGANPNPTLEGQGEQEAKLNYLIGNDSSKWQTNLSTFSQVTYQDLYEGIDLVYKGDQKQIKYEFLVSPNANYKDIKLLYQGADSLELDEQGNLLINTPFGNLKDEKPYVYQLIDGKKVPVEANFSIKDNTVGFSLADYNPDISLIIDPGLIYSTFLGGTDFDYGSGITLDSSGNAYVTGYAESSDLPTTTGAFDATHNGGKDVFVTKLNSEGSGLVYSTYLGGSSNESGSGITLDSSGNAYVTGTTYSSDFPTTTGAFDTTHLSSDGFVTKLNAEGSGLIYSTFLGGRDYDYAYGITLDSSGNAFLTGCTHSSDFPTTNGVFDSSLDDRSYGGVFVTKLNPEGSGLVYSTFLEGSSSDEGLCITLDASGNAYVTGRVMSSDFPTTTGAFDTTFNGLGSKSDAFITKLNTEGSDIIYSTYLGGSDYDLGKGITLDTSGNAYIAGCTNSSDFPTTAEAFDITHNGGNGDVFVTKLNPEGSGLVYSTFLGESGYEIGSGIVLDTSGNAYVTGNTSSSNFPITPGSFDTTYNGNNDVFVTKLNPEGSGLLYSRFLGGGSYDYGESIALDTLGNVYVTGYTNSSDFPATVGAFDTTFNSGRYGDVFVTKLDLVATDTTVPTAFDLLSPEIDAVVESLSPTFSWSPSSDSESGLDKYQLYIDGQLDKDNIPSSNTSITPTNPLTVGTHTWYVKVFDNTENVRQSNQLGQFSIADITPPTTFNLVSPENYAMVANPSPTFSWSPSSDSFSGLAKYQLYIDGQLDKDNIPSSTTSTTPTNPLTVGTHTWYVKAVDNAGNAVQSTQTFNITYSSRNAAYVASLYERILGRTGDIQALDPAGFWGWVNALDRGDRTRSQVAQAFTNSYEYHANYATFLYWYILERDPDPIGLDGWAKAMTAGLPDEKVEAYFYASDEFFSVWMDSSYEVYVWWLYIDPAIIGRTEDPWDQDPDGYYGWVDALYAGRCTRSQVALAFIESYEYHRICIVDLYEGILGRTPIEIEIHNWAVAMTNGLPDGKVVGAFFGSDEYYIKLQ